MSLHIFTGCQASGKTISCIIEATKWLDVLDHKGLFIHYKDDKRDEKNIISSNSSGYKGLSDKFDVLSVLSLDEIFNDQSFQIDDYSIICVDEIQFFPDLEKVIVKLLNTGKHIFCSGLDSDWKGDDFGQVKELLKHSTSFVKMNAKCVWCFREYNHIDVNLIPNACRTGKISGENKIIDCGGSDKYIPLCLRHHKEHLTNLWGF